MTDGLWTGIRTNRWLVVGVAFAFLFLQPAPIRERTIQLLPIGLSEVDWGTRIIEFSKGGPDQFEMRLLLALVAITVCGLIHYYSCDYSQFLPSHLHFSVNFSTAGLQEELNRYCEAELSQAGISIPDNWRELRARYLDDRNAQIARLDQDCKFRFMDMNEGDGTFSFHIVKRRDTPQAYWAHPTSFGVVDFHYSHNSDTHLHTHTLMARFLLRRDNYQDFQVPLKDALFPPGQGWKGTLSLNRSMIVRPRFSQTAYENLTKRTDIGSIVALSKVRYFPTVVLPSTLYLVEVDDIYNLERDLGDSPYKDQPITIENDSTETSHNNLGAKQMIPIACGIYR